MFVMRGIAVSFSVFVIVYSLLSLVVSLTWRYFLLRIERYPARRLADSLFALRIFPAVIAAVVIAVFTVPSFLLLEPRAIDEPVGGFSLFFGSCGAGMCVFGTLNALRAMRSASRAITSWTRHAEPIHTEVASSVPVLRITESIPAMLAAGIAHPKVLVSSLAESQLSHHEFQSALKHEVAHLRRRDNLKKLLFRLVAFPGMTALQAAWLEATEMAADDAAVSSAAEALDLAAALIKLSRIGPVQSPIDLTAALVHTPASAVNARVERLVAWTDTRQSPVSRAHFWFSAVVIFSTVAGFAVTYSELLVHVHMATEWLIR
jgi:beta-lactamase regulating signal transducer with metallopeptidase domain